VRALYGAYSGKLYQVTRASDKTTKDIDALSAGGFANAATQDTFCSGTTCTITTIYDQSSKGNHLTSGWSGGNGGPGKPATATALPLKIGGKSVYAVYMNAGDGYRNDKAVGTAINDEPEGMYMVTSGTRYNGGCCFDYGNAETSATDTGAGHMEAIYFGNSTGWGTGAAAGPWVMADMENGLFSGQSAANNAADKSVTYEFVTAMVKGEPGTWAIKAGNAQSGALQTMYSGARPFGYNPMHKEGAIILGVGGDNTEQALGNFFEGCMTSGYPSDATDNAVQANIVAAGYGQ
jgi:non-reducing end alpha-L-arabinofuranosidase